MDYEKEAHQLLYTPEYIDRSSAIEQIKEEWAKLPLSETTGFAILMRVLTRLPAADVRTVVLCRDCIYWQKPQVWQNDGTFRDYEPGEYERGSIFGGVSLEVGVNYGSFCALYNRNHENEIPQFMGENDFCSKGYKREES